MAEKTTAKNQEASTQVTPPPASVEAAKPQPVAFKNPETAKSFRTTWTEDNILHVPGVYNGPMSKLTPKGAEAALQQGFKHLVKIEG